MELAHINIHLATFQRIKPLSPTDTDICNCFFYLLRKVFVS